MNSQYQAFVQVIYPEQELGTYHKAYTYGIPFGCIVPQAGELVSVDAAGERKLAQVVKSGVRKPAFRVKPATVVTPYCPGGYVDNTYGRTIRNMTATEAACIQQAEEDAVRKVVESPLFQRELGRATLERLVRFISSGNCAQMLDERIARALRIAATNLHKGGTD